MYPDLIHPIPWSFGVDYDQLVEGFGCLPVDFLSKVTVYTVTLGRNVRCEQTLLRFLRESGVRCLELNVALSANFYDLLPTIKSIDSLDFSYFGGISLEFLFEMLPNVVMLQIRSHKLPMHFLKRLLKKIKNQIEFNIYALGSRIFDQINFIGFGARCPNLLIRGSDMPVKEFKIENLTALLKAHPPAKHFIDFGNLQK